MNKTIRIVMLAAALIGAYATGFSQAPLDKYQIRQVNRGYGMFIHFGLNTFNETEWSDGTLPISSYNPDKLDCDQWIKTAKEAGFRYVILVTKHHDGFCLWNSKYTDCDVASSPVKTDVVAAVAKACKKYGIELGLYYSLWDRKEPSHASKDPQDYVNFMKNQLTELLSNYGPVAEIWFDGGWAKKIADWHPKEVYDHIKSIQPSCLVTFNHTVGETKNINAIGQPKDFKENDPLRYYPVDFRTKDPNLARWDDPKVYSYNGEKHYLIFEHTICISDKWNWFQKRAMLPVRPVDELEELFYWCTSNQNILIVNIPPDEHGLIREHERLRILELADRLGIRNGKKTLPAGYVNMAFNKPIVASNADDAAPASNAVDYSLETSWKAKKDTASLVIDFNEPLVFDRVVLFEKGTEVTDDDGFSTTINYGVTSFSIDVFDGKWTTVYVGKEMASCKIIKFAEQMKGTKMRLNILSSKATPAIAHIAVSSYKSYHNRPVLKAK